MAESNSPYEAKILMLSCDKLKKVFGWNQVWNVSQAVEKTVELYIDYMHGSDIGQCMLKQIREYYEA